MCRSSASISPLVARPTRFCHQGPGGKFDVLRDGRQEAAFIPGDRVSGHAEPFSEFALRETKAEPLTAKLPAGQWTTGYLREHAPVNVGPSRSESRLLLPLQGHQGP